MKSKKNIKLFSTLILTSLQFISLRSSALQFEDLMWGLKNKGQTITLDLNPLQSYRLQGRPDQDIRLLPAVKGKKIKVAVIDTGVDINHPDLKEFIFKNTAQCAAYDRLLKCQKDQGDVDSVDCRKQELSEKENIYPADCYGWSLLDQNLKGEDGRSGYTPNNIIGRPDFNDLSGHGTHVAGTIISVTKNVEIIPIQFSGIGPNQPLKTYSIDLSPNENIRGGYQTNYNLSERMARGIIYAMNSGAQVINLSLGWPENQNTDIIKEAIAEAQRRGILIVAAAGNDSTTALLRPCQYKNVICVAATRPDGALAAFSNYGSGVDIAAPGVEILSTIPFDVSSVRLPGYKGYDYLSGTSQATPYVTGVIAEMLSRGVPAEEIYPRLILGARKFQEENPVIVGPIHQQGKLVNTKSPYKKTILSGQLDMAESMNPNLKAQTLILPADKNTQVIEWDRKSAKLQFKFNLKNYWKSLENKNVTVQLRSSRPSEIEPALIKAEILNNQNKVWKMNEERSVQVDLEIRDAANPSQSRLPSELAYQVYVMIDGVVHRQFEVTAEIIVMFTKEMQDPEMQNFKINGSLPQGSNFTLVDEVFDGNSQQKDYLIIDKDATQKNTLNIALVKMQPDNYEIQPIQSVEFAGSLDVWRPKYKIRMDIDGDGNSEYVIGIIEYTDKNLGINGPYRNHFYIFDQNMKLKSNYLFDDKRVFLPIQFFWMKVGKSMRPAWVGMGQEIKKIWDVTDLWAVDSYKDVKIPSDIRFYYLDENFKLAHANTQPLTRIVDIIQPTVAQQQKGILPVLIAKNLGTEVSSSYLNEFSIGEMQNGQLMSLEKLNQSGTSFQLKNYRNLVDTFQDKAFSLNTGASEFKGTMWYGLDAHQKQRVTILDMEQKRIYDKLVTSQKNIFDAALLIKAGFVSKKRQGAFLMTNSEIEYHELNSSQVASRSLNRYSFIGQNPFIQLHFPITVLDRKSEGDKLPALFTTEGTGLNKGFKLMLPLHEANGKVDKIISPARLSFKAAKGCKALGNPVFLGEGSGYALDYFCGDMLKRLLLKY